MRFWEDIKWDNISLKSAFLRIFALASNKEGVINEFGSWIDSNWVWGVKVRRRLFDWELDQWNGFLLSLECISVRRQIEDVLAWRHYPNGIFFVGSFRRCLEEELHIDSVNTRFTSQGLCPPKIEVFIWNIQKGRAPVSKQWTIYSFCASGLGAFGQFIYGGGGGLDHLGVRNKRVFEGKDANLQLASDLVKFQAGWWFKYIRGGCIDPTTTLPVDIKDRCVDMVSFKVIRSESRVLSPINSLFFNVDGSARGNLSEAGGHSFNCEVIIVNNSKVAVSWYKGDDFGNINLIDLVYDIRSSISSQEGVSIKVMPRGGNSFADGLTKLGSSRSGDKLQWGVF
ncbi:hypothetical protein Ddye_008411 [Dipteronia dyeriana]|uniref:Uncharacterized protein n=1 Tax=Dipteronia dyeriana TaxID=168575 RepID=A0AAE0CLC2_9ROSI|nr:hypothetical protein Ddye_008411 [Dipteronia dyeriana]